MFTEPHILTLGGLGEFSKVIILTTSRLLYISNSPNPPRVKMRLCKHGKSALLLNCDMVIMTLCTCAIIAI